MPGDELTPAARELVGDRDRLLRVAGVVADLQHQLLAEHAALGVDVGDRQLRAILQLLAEGGVLSGNRSDHGDRDGLVFFPAAAAGERGDSGQCHQQPGNSLHGRLPSRFGAHSTPFGESASVRIRGEQARKPKPTALGPGAPGKRARALVEPAILGDHLRRAHGAVAETSRRSARIT